MASLKCCRSGIGCFFSSESRPCGVARVSCSSYEDVVVTVVVVVVEEVVSSNH